MNSSAMQNPIPETGATERLILRLAHGDLAAMTPLYEEAKDAVFGYALSVLKHREDAEDVTHDCFVSVYRTAPSYQPLGKPMAWIITIARNLCRMKLRDRKKFADLPDGEWQTDIEDTSRRDPDDAIVLRACMEQLSDEEREILVLHTVSGLKHREIAELFGMPLGTVLSKYKRTLAKMNEYLTKGTK